jgi:hypothetical protein
MRVVGNVAIDLTQTRKEEPNRRIRLHTGIMDETARSLVGVGSHITVVKAASSHCHVWL